MVATTWTPGAVVAAAVIFAVFILPIVTGCVVLIIKAIRGDEDL